MKTYIVVSMETDIEEDIEESYRTGCVVQKPGQFRTLTVRYPYPYQTTDDKFFIEKLVKVSTKFMERHNE